MVKENCSISDLIETLSDTLPTCKIRDLAYSTFTLLQLDNRGTARLVEYDNPPAIFLSDNKIKKIEYFEHQIKGKNIKEAQLNIQDGDIIVLMSDGEIHPGLNGKCDLRWNWDRIAHFVNRISEKSMSSQDIAFELTNVANQFYGQEPGDDTSIIVIRARIRRFAAIMIGAPGDRNKDPEIVKDLMQQPGHKIICGGTTGNIVSRETGKPFKVLIPTMIDDIPPMGIMEGFDLCTEGIITISNALKLLRQKVSYKKLELSNNGASRLVQELLRADEIKFFVGQASNPANISASIPSEFGHKTQLTHLLIKELEALGKRIELKLY